MPIEILMPALSPTMTEGKLAKWLVKEGDTIQSGDVLAEVETDKATIEFEAADDGVVGKILVMEGAEGILVNAPIAVLLEDGESVDDIVDAPASAPTNDAAASETNAMGNGADHVAPLPIVDESAPSATRTPTANGHDNMRIFATPLARRIAADKGIDLASITGSGPHGRIVKADVENAKPGAVTGAATMATTTGAHSGAMGGGAHSVAVSSGLSTDTVLKMYADREFTEVPLDGMRSTIASRLTESKQTIPHFYLRREIKMDALLALRKELNAGLEPRGVRLSVNDFIIKACANALQAVPDCNAVWASDRVLKLKPSDVAVAVAIEGGLFTPVLRDADQKSLSTLSAEMKDLAGRARERKLAPHEYVGGSFSISNLGAFGIENFDAVINPPHGSILAVGGAIKKPIVGDGDQIEIASMMSVTLSVDHRVIDGALGAEFLAAIVQNLENPLAMLA